MAENDPAITVPGRRSPRELVILAGGAAISMGELFSRHVDWGNLCVYVGAIAQQWPHLRGGLDHANIETLAILPLAAIALLSSRDLVERYDRAPTLIFGIPNPWAAYTLAQTRTIRWSCYAAGALAGLLDHTLQSAYATAPLWPRAAMVGLMVSIGLLFIGRAIGLLTLWGITVAVAVLIAPSVLVAEQVLSHELFARDVLYTSRAIYILPIFVLAVAAAAIATPFTLRLLRRTLLGGGAPAAESTE
ncbi:MAG: hypothetical protein H6710_15765 [Myxococcales bacterium]|nr:hypothetical protein [Myxococcales bacterium]